MSEALNINNEKLYQAIVLCNRLSSDLVGFKDVNDVFIAQQNDGHVCDAVRIENEVRRSDMFASASFLFHFLEQNGLMDTDEFEKGKKHRDNIDKKITKPNIDKCITKQDVNTYKKPSSYKVSVHVYHQSDVPLMTPIFGRVKGCDDK